jgi:chitin deacetylase
MVTLVACTSLFLLPRQIQVDWEIPLRYKRTTILNRAKSFADKTIALTFDDGPDPKVTPKILDILKKYDVKATFFVLGKAAKRHPMLLRRIAAEGHAIGNHSWSHGKEKSKDQAISELIRTNQAVIFATGNCPTVFRPPYGIRDGEYAAQAKAMGMASVLWTSIDGDTLTDSAEKMLAYVGTPKNGEIILCHDGPGKTATPQMVSMLVAKLKKQKYEFATVPELLGTWDKHLALVENNERVVLKQIPTLVALRRPMAKR